MAFIALRLSQITVWMMLSVGSVEQLENCTLEMEMRKTVTVFVRYCSRLTIWKCVYALFLCLSHSFLKVSHSINMLTNKSNIHVIKSHISRGSVQKKNAQELFAAYKLLCYRRRDLFVCVSHIARPSGRNWVGLYEGAFDTAAIAVFSTCTVYVILFHSLPSRVGCSF